MNIEIIKIQFDRDEDGSVPFSDRNLETLVRYVIPVIANNRGWSTEDLTMDNFLENPERWRDDLDATVEKDLDGEVFIALDNDEPVGLLEYVESDFQDVEPLFAKKLHEMTTDKNSESWSEVKRYVKFDEDLFDSLFSQLNEYIFTRKFYKDIGVVLLPELQGQKSGISDQLYMMMKDGFIFGWTSTPLVISKRRKLYKETVFFPPTGEEICSIGSLACLTVVSARILSLYPETIKEFDFGNKTYIGFALRDREEYMNLSKSFLDRGKISLADYDRFDKILEHKKGQGAVISIN